MVAMDWSCLPQPDNFRGLLTEKAEFTLDDPDNPGKVSGVHRIFILISTINSRRENTK
jgi:hypothetical protein